ncbi:MAG: GNAT family N-acetyltransferase [Ruminiclostridium sp.]|nr:GNAT family N-acetyltransferase [Ruminiclostridium sp.]
MEIVVRPMQSGEAAEVHKIGRRAFTWFESLWVSKPREALVAVKDGTIVGAILYKFMKTRGTKIGYIDYAFIDPHYHNQGIGGRLYKASIDFLWEQGCDALTAIVKDDNVGSWGLFLKNGFERVSLSEGVRQLGLWGMLGQYLGTPFCFGAGMEFYVALRDKTCVSGKGGSIKQLAAYISTNLLLFLLTIFRRPENALTFFIAYFIFLSGGILAGYFGTLLSRRKWHFRFNNGGGLVCASIQLTGNMFPMVGNWYPEEYENSDEFRKDMGMTALFGWVFVLFLSILSILMLSQHVIFRYFREIGFLFLIYRILAIYPFESYGGRRIYQWKRGIYLLMAIISLAVMAIIYFS